MPEIQEIQDNDSDNLKIKYYTVRQGRRCGIFSSFDALIDATHGYPNVEYDIFESIQEADQYLCPYIEATGRAHPCIPPNAVNFELSSINVNKELYHGFSFVWGPRDKNNHIEAMDFTSSREKAELLAFAKLLHGTKKYNELMVITGCVYLMNRLKDEECKDEFDELVTNIKKEMVGRKITFKNSNACLGIWSVRLACMYAQRASIMIANQLNKQK